MDARLQRRVQRYGWDLAAAHFDALWREQLAPAQAAMLAMAVPAAGEHVLDVACGTGVASEVVADAVGAKGGVLGVDISQAMVDAAAARAKAQGLVNLRFARMDAERLDLADASFDLVLCALGLMYLPDPAAGLREMRRVLRPGGRVAVAVWGERARCGWSTVFPIVDAEVISDVCPLFFQLGQPGALAAELARAGFEVTQERRLSTTLVYGDGDAAADAALIGGPVALAWSHFDAATQVRVRERYLQSIGAWRDGAGYRVGAEFVVASARVSG